MTKEHLRAWDPGEAPAVKRYSAATLMDGSPLSALGNAKRYTREERWEYEREAYKLRVGRYWDGMDGLKVLGRPAHPTVRLEVTVAKINQLVTEYMLNGGLRTVIPFAWSLGLDPEMFREWLYQHPEFIARIMRRLAPKKGYELRTIWVDLRKYGEIKAELTADGYVVNPLWTDPNEIFNKTLAAMRTRHAAYERKKAAVEGLIPEAERWSGKGKEKRLRAARREKKPS